jgi:hypothetical protein
LSDATVPQTVLFPDLFAKRLVAAFDRPDASSDGGAILLPAVDRRLGVIDALAASLPDDRDPAKVTHPLRDLVA